MDGTRVSIWFEEQKDFYSGFVNYDTEYVSGLAGGGKAAYNDDSGSHMHYLPKYDGGDEEHVPWRAIQIGIRNISPAAAIDVAHKHPLPSGQLNTDTGRLWGLRGASSQDLLGIFAPIFPEMKDIIEGTGGCGSQFQGQTNAGRVARSASSAISVRRRSAISMPGHGKNHSDHQGYTMNRNLKELTLSGGAPVLSGTRDIALALAQHRP